nr:hypothetical protein [Hyphomonas sp. 34-62-18]
MKKHEEHLRDDEFAPIELGTITEETKGVDPRGEETFSGQFNSKIPD